MTISGADGAGASAPEASVRVPVKRNRIQLSCTHCRHAKLKCDRERPCSQCVKRGRSSECAFLPPVARKRPAVSMHNRLKHLESLVKGAMAAQPADEPSDTGGKRLSPLPDPASDLQGHAEMAASGASGRVVLGPNEATYVGATHWAAMLDDVGIGELKEYFSETAEETSLDAESVPPDLTLLVSNAVPVATHEDLLAALPERTTVNRLVSRHFNSNSPALHIIHTPTFQRTYRNFWADPRDSPANFLGLIYAIMCLGIFATLEAGEEYAGAEGTPLETIQFYRGCCSRCLALSDYAKHPGPYTLETFLIYMECEFMLTGGDQMSCYLLIGVAVRLALRMGLHRDSDNVGGNSITPYQSEMRRRVWHLLVQTDLLASFHIGLPSMVQAVKSDTRTPLNLQNEDFDETSTHLPPSRPETEVTVMSYTLAKGRLAHVFGKVVEQVNLLALPDYSEVTALDQDLQQAFSAVPPFLRVVPIDLCITDSAALILRRFSVAMLFHKSRCILHRKYLMKIRDNAEFSYSKKAAIDASRELLRIQAEVHNAAQPGGLLFRNPWVTSSLAMHDLLVAAVIIYLCLVQESVGAFLPNGSQQIPNSHQTEMIAALEGSSRIWSETRSTSADTAKAYGVLCSMLKRLNTIFQRHNVLAGTKSGADGAPGHETGESMSSLSFSESAPLPKTQASAFGRSSVRQYGGVGHATTLSSPTTLSNLDIGSIPVDISGEPADGVMNFDWDIFDNQVRQTQVNDLDPSWSDIPDISFQGLNSIDDNYCL